MCRLMAYMGDPILIAHAVLWPDRSIIKQSYDAKERLYNPNLPFHLCHGNLNGDGFGIGWFCEKSQSSAEDTPCVFTSVTPAWNNDNLSRLASKITSPLIFAHVRAAYPDMPVTEQNCHPFQWGRYLWMHNGNVGGFSKIRRELASILSDKAYNAVPSFHSDSAMAFGVFLNFLEHMDRKQSPQALLKAMEQTIFAITEIVQKHEVEEGSLLNFVVSDGSTMIATRYVYPFTSTPASLYYAEGNSFRQKIRYQSENSALDTKELQSNSVYELTYAEQGSGVAFIASEPITGNPSDWVEVPKNHALIITHEKSGYVNIMRTPLVQDHSTKQQNEVSMCLEAIGQGIEVTARTWSAKTKSELPTRLSRKQSDPIPILEKEDDLISGQAAAVLCLAVDMPRRRLYASLTDGNVHVLDLTSHQLIHQLRAHEDPVLKIVLQDRYLYTTGGHRLRIWDLESYQCVYAARMQAGDGILRALAVSQGSVYVGGQDARVKLFQLKPGHFSSKSVKSIEEKMDWCDRTTMGIGHLSSIHCLEICGDYICSTGGDSVIRVWKKDNLEFVRVLRGHRGSVLTCKGYGNILLSGGRDNTVRVWDLEVFLSRRALTGHKNDILKIAMLCPGSLGWTSEITRQRTRRSLSVLSSGDPCLVASCSADCTIRLWSMSTWQCIRIFNLFRLDHPIPSHRRQGSSTSLVSSFLTSNPMTLAQAQANAICNATPLSLEVTKKKIYAGTRGGNICIWNIDDIVQNLSSSFEENEDIQMITNNFAFMKMIPNGVDSNRSFEKGKDIESQTRSIIEAELIQSLSDFVPIRTISANIKCKEDCFKGAKFLARHLEELGAKVKLAKCFEDKNPVVIGKLGDSPTKPTITFYGHYDVQPANEVGWETKPFEVFPRDGFLYGRGVSDNKGPILAFIYAIKEIIETKSWAPKTEPLPINIAFIFEGEEENGSKGTLEAIKENIHWFNNNILTIVSNTQWVGETMPCLTYGMRGMISLDISVYGPQHDIHSGNDGGVCNEPMVDLVKLLATLVDSHSDICIPGFYDDVAPNLLDAAWDGLSSSQEFSPEGYQKALGLPGLSVPNSKVDILRARWCKPTLSVVDMRTDGGIAVSKHEMDHYRFGPTRFSVIPCHAVGKVSIRFVPKQDKDKMITCIKNHVEHEFAKLRSKNTVSVDVVTSGDWWEANTSSKFFNLAKQAIYKAWGHAPLTVREGGTMPLASSLEKVLGANALLIPMGQASDNCHLANERIRRLNLIKGKDIIKNLLEDIFEELQNAGVKDQQ